MMLYGPLLVWIAVASFGPYDVTQGISSKIVIRSRTYSLGCIFRLLAHFFCTRFYISLPKKEKYDSLAIANAKSGVIFTIVTLLSGSYWGKLTWGTWWVWGDARLNLTAILLLVYLGYIASRQFNKDLAKTAKKFINYWNLWNYTNSNFAFQCYMVEICSPASKHIKSGNCCFR